MKKVLFLDSGPGQGLSESHYETVNEMCKKLSADGSFEYELAAVQHLAIDIRAGQVSMRVDGHKSIDDYAFIIFRNPQVNRDLSAAVTLYLLYRKIPFANGVEGSAALVGKLAQMVLFATNDLPVPDTLSTRNYADLQELAGKRYTEPFILKDSLGFAGRRNYLVDSADSMANLLKDSSKEIYLTQPYIRNDGDFRVLYVGLERDPLIFKRHSSTDSHLNNTSQGAQASLVPIADFSAEALKSARRAAELFGRRIVGVDVLFDESGKHYILEANETPSLASGFATAEKLKMVEAYMKDSIR